MKRFHLLFAAFSCFGATVLAGPIPLFQNFGVITNAIQIDALAFDNRGTFDINSELPYDMQNVINFTNRNLMSSAGGFRFDTIKLPTKRHPLVSRIPADNFVNSGTIISSGFFGSFAFGGIGGLIPNGLAGISQSSYILVNATNIDGSNGLFEVDSPGLLRLKGGTTDLSRSALVAGDPFGGGGGGFGGYIIITSGNNTRTNYLLPSDITEIYGGAGTQTNNLESSFGLIPPDVFSPFHRVFFPGGGTNGTFVSLPFDSLAQFDGVANVSTNSGEKLVQAVFVNTNLTDPNISARVTFASSTIAGAINPNVSDPTAPAVIVQFTSSSYDPISGGTASNTVSFIDTSGMQTNLIMFTNFNASTHVKPSSYEVTTANIGDPGLPGNTPYTPELLYNPAVHASNIVVGFYGGYGVTVGGNSSLLATPNQEVNPTNRSPRIEVDSDNLDLTLTRMRSEGPILLKTKHLISDQGADISAGLIQADIGSTNGFLRISSLFPTNFQRLTGDIYGYSFIWENQEADPDSGETNNVRYHILIVDQAFTANIRPSIDTVILRSTNLVVENDLKLDRIVKFESQNLTINSLIEVPNLSLTETNFVGLKNFILETNGIMAGENLLSIGFDKPQGIDSFANFGRINAVSTLVRARNFINSGVIQPSTNIFGNPFDFLTTGTNIASGSIVIQADDATLSDGTLSAGQLIDISAGDLIATNSTIIAGGVDILGNQLFGRLVLNVTNLITDFGEGANNVWEVSNGFELTRKPFQGDLLGTEIRTISSGFRSVTHRWAGQDAGPGPDGFVNNATIGHLILDIRSANSKLRFTGTGSQNALYVKTLDFELDPSINIDTDLNNLLQIDSNFRIYFINSNAGDKLVTAFPDRVIQVPDFGLGQPVAPLSVSVNGFGIVTPNLNGKLLKVGDRYQVKAKPGRGQMFKAWSGGTNSNDPVLSFTMRPNLVLRANMVPSPFDDSANPVAGTYNGLFSETNGVRHESSGYISIKLSKKGSFSGKIISGKTYPFRGSFDASGHAAEVSVHRPHQTDLSLDLQIDLANHSDQINGTVTGENWVAALIADRARAGNIVEPGRYTMVIPGGDAPAPNGDGYGTITVNGRGDLHFKGALADGTTVNQKTSLSKNGQWPFYSALYHGTGSVLSWITFTNDASGSLVGDLAWFKKPGPGRNFQDGFTNMTSVIGSSYVPAKPVLAITDGTVTLSGGNLGESLVNGITLGSNNVVTTTGTNRLSIKISSPTGLVKGTFQHPDTGKKTVLKGVVLQQQNGARGFFLDADKSGAVILE